MFYNQLAWPAGFGSEKGKASVDKFIFRNEILTRFESKAFWSGTPKTASHAMPCPPPSSAEAIQDGMVNAQLQNVVRKNATFLNVPQYFTCPPSAVHHEMHGCRTREVPKVALQLCDTGNCFNPFREQPAGQGLREKLKFLFLW